DDGRYAAVGGSATRILATLVFGSLYGLFSRKRLGLLVHRQNHRDMATVLQMVQEQQLKVAKDTVYEGLQQSAAALQHLHEGRACGKVVVQITQ
ncbi:hypothetical protein HDU91_000782, partial [Kappamyces sp. JEL0680]